MFTPEKEDEAMQMVCYRHPNIFVSAIGNNLIRGPPIATRPHRVTG